jgi:hypothetical protein
VTEPAKPCNLNFARPARGPDSPLEGDFSLKPRLGRGFLYENAIPPMALAVPASPPPSTREPYLEADPEGLSATDAWAEPLPVLPVRKATLASIVAKARPGIRFNEHIEGDGPTVFAQACKMGLEGIVSKRKDSAYRSGARRIGLR